MGDGLDLAAMEVRGGKRWHWGQWRWKALALLFGSDGSVGVCVGGGGGVMCWCCCWQRCRNGVLRVLELALMEVEGVHVGAMELGGVAVGSSGLTLLLVCVLPSCCHVVMEVGGIGGDRGVRLTLASEVMEGSGGCQWKGGVRHGGCHGQLLR